MSHKFDGNSKTVNLEDFPVFPNKFIVRPNNTAANERKQRGKKNHVFGQPFLLKHNDTDSRYGNSNSIPNLKGIPNGRTKTRQRHQFSREDTFDADFMMPSRVREVLQAEGLENSVINGAIAKSETKHADTWRKMAIESELTNPREALPGQHQTAGTTQRSPETLTSPIWHPADKLDRGGAEAEAQPCNQGSGQRVCSFSTDSLYKRLNLDREDHILERDRRKWMNEQTEEQMFCGRIPNCPRVVLVSSKVHKCQQMSTICQEDVILVIYDFDNWTFADIIESVTKKLRLYRKYCKARSIMLYCQGGPGYIYLLRNFAVTPQKLQKPSYRGVIGFWKSLGCLLSKLKPAEAVVHIAGFRLLDDETGHKLLPMLQGIMYPNLVRVEAPDEEKETGRNIVGLYFQYRKYKLWKAHHTEGDKDHLRLDRLLGGKLL